MERRNYGIDLLRMLAMWMVIILHILNKGGVLSAAAPLSAGYEAAKLLEAGAYCAVNCYGLISGYVGVQHRFRYSGAVALWLRVTFYTVSITAVFAAFLPGSVDGDRVLRAFFPVLFRQYWYVTAYFGMCLFIPFFNLLLDRLSERQRRVLALFIVLVFSVLPTLRQRDVFLTDNGYSVLWLSCLYLLGSCLRLSCLGKKRGSGGWAAVYAICAVLTWSVHWAADRVWIAAERGTCDKVLLTFSVYLIHAHPLIWEYGMADRFSVLAAKTPPVMLLLVLGAALGIYGICSLMDVLRVWIFRLLHMDELSRRVEAGTSACLGRWLDKE